MPRHGAGRHSAPPATYSTAIRSTDSTPTMGNWQPRAALPAQGPVQTLGAGYALLRSGFNDVLVLIGNGTSTGISAFARHISHGPRMPRIWLASALPRRFRNAPASLPHRGGTGGLREFLHRLRQWLSVLEPELVPRLHRRSGRFDLRHGERHAQCLRECDFEGMGDATSAADAGSRNDSDLRRRELFQSLQRRPRHSQSHQRQRLGGGRKARRRATSSRIAPSCSYSETANTYGFTPLRLRRLIAFCCSGIACSSTRWAIGGDLRWRRWRHWRRQSGGVVATARLYESRHHATR